MLRWKKKLQGLNSAELDEFEMFMNPGEIPDNDEPAGGGAEDVFDDQNTEEVEEDGEVDVEESEEDSPDDNADPTDSDDTDDSDPSDNQNVIKTLQEQNQKLMQILEKLTNKEESEPEPEPEPSISDPFETDMLDSMAATFNWDSEEKSVFKTFFKQYTDAVVSNTLRKAQEITPEVVNKSLTKQQKVEAVRKDFYSRHPALENVKAYVGQVAGQLAKENKNASLDQILEEAAKRSYQVFGLKPNKSGNQERKAEKGKTPAFPKTKGARKKAPKKSALQSELDAMLALDE